MQQIIKIIKLLLIACVLFITSCKKDCELKNTSSADELVFGNFYGFCAGNCFNAFGMNNQVVQRDTATHYLYNYLNYQFTGSITLADSLYQQVSYLLNEIPAELTTETTKTFGCPDCHDQGGIYVEINRDGIKRRFAIDNDNTSDQSQELVDFKLKLRAASLLLMQ